MTETSVGAPSSLRAQLARLAAAGLLHRVQKEVDPAWELSAVARQMFLQPDPERRYAIVFERVRGSQYPVVVGALAASRTIYADGLEVAPDAILERWAAALRAPIEPRLVEGGLPDEIVVEGDAVDLTTLPIPTWTPTRDGAPYIGGPYCITQDPDT